LADAADKVLKATDGMVYADSPPGRDPILVMHEELTKLSREWHQLADDIASKVPTRRGPGAPASPATTYRAAREYLRQSGIPDRVAQEFLRSVRP